VKDCSRLIELGSRLDPLACGLLQEAGNFHFLARQPYEGHEFTNPQFVIGVQIVGGHLILIWRDDYLYFLMPASLFVEQLMKAGDFLWAA
jgi:hypothetical protein